MHTFERVWVLLFVITVLPVAYYGIQFRKVIYQTDNWKIILFKHSPLKELKALFGNLYPENEKYIRTRNLFRLYLGAYIMLITFFVIFNTRHKMNKIEIGSSVPGFILPNQNGKLFDVNTVLGKKNLVIYFYPKDDSPGCTKEACYFQDQFEVFKKENAMIIGISGQSVESHKEFAMKYKLTYTLLSNEGNLIRKLFGLPTNFLCLLPGRVTYIVNKKGKVVYVFDSQTQVTKHVDEALRILKLLQ